MAESVNSKNGSSGEGKDSREGSSSKMDSGASKGGKAGSADKPQDGAKANNNNNGGGSGAAGGGGSNTNANNGGGGSNVNVDGVLSATVDDNSNEWRNSHGGSSQGVNSSDHFEPSTSFAEEDDDGVRPSDLYGKFTWKIENFSEISKRELRSNVFEVGEYKWYILVYPQGCDVSNHLSLFLCVADYDKLLPGWSHFAQFTIAVVNKDPKKSKYSDTLHRFCKKEHDWGWKKFMELSKVLDGFTVSDTLVIKAQVQVIREKQNRPFRCLDTQYRRELVRVYLTNVEGICRRFLEERRDKLAKLRECPESFHEFWDSLSLQLRSCLASDRADNILKLLVKRFFNEKEVTSTLVMDALHSGYKSLQVDQRPSLAGAKDGDGGKGGGSSSSAAAGGAGAKNALSEPPVSISMEQNLTYLTGDVMKTLETAANETVPPHSEDKDLDDYGKDSLERDERRLAELGRQAIEMFVLSHLYINRIEVAFKENEALKRQEALIREEEEAERLEEERQQKKAEAERERRNRRKEKKQRKKEKKEAEEAAAEAERKAAEEEKKRKDEERRKRDEAARKLREEQLEKEREAARQAAKEKEAAKKAARKAAQEEARKKMEREAEQQRLQREKEEKAAAAAAAQAAREKAASEEKVRLEQQQQQREKEAERQRLAKERELQLQQQQQQQEKQRKGKTSSKEVDSSDKSAVLQEKDRQISELSSKVEALELQMGQRDGTISKLQSQLKQALEALQQVKERSNEWQQAAMPGSGSAPGTPEQQKISGPSVDYQRNRSSPGGRNGSPGTAAPESVMAQEMVSPIKAYAASVGSGAANPRGVPYQSMPPPKGFQQPAAAAASMRNGGHPMPPGRGMPAGVQPNGMPGAPQTAAAALVNGKGSEYGQMMMPPHAPLANQGSYRLAPVGQPPVAGAHGAMPPTQGQDPAGLDDFAHMGLITDLLD